MIWLICFLFVLSWLHDEKDDGLTERVLSVEMVGKNAEPTSTDEQMGDKEFQEEYQDQEVGLSPTHHPKFDLEYSILKIIRASHSPTQ